MENHHAINGKINYKWPCSIAMLNYQRVFHGKSENEMDENWGYPYLKKPPFQCFVFVVAKIWTRVSPLFLASNISSISMICI